MYRLGGEVATKLYTKIGKSVINRNRKWLSKKMKNKPRGIIIVHHL